MFEKIGEFLSSIFRPEPQAELSNEIDTPVKEDTKTEVKSDSEETRLVLGYKSFKYRSDGNGVITSKGLLISEETLERVIKGIRKNITSFFVDYDTINIYVPEDKNNKPKIGLTFVKSYSAIFYLSKKTKTKPTDVKLRPAKSSDTITDVTIKVYVDK